MKQILKYGLLWIVILWFCSCSSPKYFHDISSFNRQKEIRNTRSANVFSDILVGSATIIASACIGEEIEWQPTQQNFKKLSLINPTSDTIYVNMLTDIYWDKDDYCDFMDIRIPPKQLCRILVPVNAVYNVYFSGTPQNDDDEMIEIKTSEKSRINLLPGMTLISDIK
jgi:hypothetical protein